MKRKKKETFRIALIFVLLLHTDRVVNFVISMAFWVLLQAISMHIGSVNELSTLGGVLHSILKIPCFHLQFTLAHTHTYTTHYLDCIDLILIPPFGFYYIGLFPRPPVFMGIPLEYMVLFSRRFVFLFSWHYLIIPMHFCFDCFIDLTNSSSLSLFCATQIICNVWMWFFPIYFLFYQVLLWAHHHLNVFSQIELKFNVLCFSNVHMSKSHYFTSYSFSM
jgi:hypothetical protein